MIPEVAFDQWAVTPIFFVEAGVRIAASAR